jgi:hypothetical protein
MPSENEGTRLKLTARNADELQVEATGEDDRPLHVCPRCAGTLVQPVEWAAASEGDLEVLLRCPDCCWQEAGVYGPALIDALDRELERGFDSLLGDLHALAHANIAAQVEAFARALRLDLVLPSDFGTN